jgi:hypothetical protein
MQAVYVLNGVQTSDISMITADAIRAQLGEIRVYVLAQQGQRDDSFLYPATSVLVGPDTVNGRNFDVSGLRNYRWKVYSIVVHPANLAN